MAETITQAYSIPELGGDTVLLVTVKAENGASEGLDYIVQKAVEQDTNTLKELSEWEQDVEHFSFSKKPIREVTE